MSSDPVRSLTDRTVKPYEAYKKMVLFFALVDQLYTTLFNSVPTGTTPPSPTTGAAPAAPDAASAAAVGGAVGGAGAAAGVAGQNSWSGQLATWIRNNDDTLLKKTAKVLSVFQVTFLKILVFLSL